MKWRSIEPKNESSVLLINPPGTNLSIAMRWVSNDVNTLLLEERARMQGLTFRIIQFPFTCFPPLGRLSIEKADPVPIKLSQTKKNRSAPVLCVSFGAAESMKGANYTRNNSREFHSARFHRDRPILKWSREQWRGGDHTNPGLLFNWNSRKCRVRRCLVSPSLVWRERHALDFLITNARANSLMPARGERHKWVLCFFIWRFAIRFTRRRIGEDRLLMPPFAQFGERCLPGTRHEGSTWQAANPPLLLPMFDAPRHKNTNTLDINGVERKRTRERE